MSSSRPVQQDRRHRRRQRRRHHRPQTSLARGQTNRTHNGTTDANQFQQPAESAGKGTAMSKHGKSREQEKKSLPLYTKGMEVTWDGTNPLKQHPEDKAIKDGGAGTVGDPMVAWHPHREEVLKEMEQPLRKSQVDVVRDSCKDYGFACVVIRKEAHEKQYQYDEFGKPVFTTLPDGTLDHALVDADLHLTVSMGPSLTNALVSGHIFLVKVTCPETGQTIVLKMDNPEEQRSIVRPGLDRVAEEFWATNEPTFQHRTSMTSSKILSSMSESEGEGSEGEGSEGEGSGE